MCEECQWKHLERHPQSSYKQLFIKGTRIRAEIIYDSWVDAEPPEPTTPEEVAADWNLPVEAVREAIAYCPVRPAGDRRRPSEEREHLQALGVLDADGNYLRGSLPHLPPERPSEK